jgi:MtN3 and saliva related transmembrane protein
MIEDMNQVIDIAWYAVGLTAASLTMFGFVPQVIKMLRTKFVRDLSFVMLVQIIIGVFLWVLYGIHIRDPIVIFANVVALITLIIAITLYLLYRNNSANQSSF